MKGKYAIVRPDAEQHLTFYCMFTEEPRTESVPWSPIFDWQLSYDLNIIHQRSRFKKKVHYKIKISEINLDFAGEIADRNGKFPAWHTIWFTAVLINQKTCYNEFIN